MTSTIAAQYRGCLLGLAVGDALGAPIEFMSIEQIKSTYGPDGLTGPAGKLEYTDDTQMSLATAVGCLQAYAQQLEQGFADPVAVVYDRYLDWLKSQDHPAQRRAPGNTCLSALASGKQGRIAGPINNSKGCGGVMRTAPVGMAFEPGPRGEAFRRGAEFAAITHGHPSGYLTAGFLAEMIAHVVRGRDLRQAIDLSTRVLIGYDGHEETLGKIVQARELAAGSTGVEQAIAELGGGWVGEEALAIGLYCALKYPGDWRKAVLAAVNHSGDSDSTGCICGAILGASLGLNAIPGEWVRGIENGAGIMRIADDMYRAFQKHEPPLRDDYPGN
ncbi:MAG TPA: ADP-ribosylglycohydrolase family protein [Chloroflexia bacterium]|nr:ADP-ribosylglycohydrolase family protein [Chloroflexia bacterium]